MLDAYVRGSVVKLYAVSPFSPAQPQATDVIPALRAIRAGDTIGTRIGGHAAAGYDFLAAMNERIPLMALTVIVAMLVVLFLLFGSVVLPVKAVLMTLLSLSASFGALVWIFQEGHLQDLLHFQSPGYTVAGNPIIMFAVIVGLSMDYEVLLLSRIQEVYRRHGGQHGLRRGGPGAHGGCDHGGRHGHGRGLRGLLPGRHDHDQEHRRGHGDRGLPGRHDHPCPAGSGHHAVAGQLELVGARAARPAGRQARLQPRRGRGAPRRRGGGGPDAGRCGDLTPGCRGGSMAEPTPRRARPSHGTREVRSVGGARAPRRARPSHGTREVRAVGGARAPSSIRGTIRMMSTIAERYDRDAEDYERYWAPVLDASARQLLDRIEPFMARNGGGAQILDVGTGTGVLALEALARWPAARLVGADASSGMLAMARVRAAHAGRPADDPNLRWLHAPADRLTLQDGSVDAIVSSFVYQLVPDRSAAFREAHRVLRPGGPIAFVTWLDRDGDFEPAVEFDEAVYDLDIEEPEEEPEEIRAGDFRGPRAAANELRRAGFVKVSARVEPLEYRWSREAYLAFKQHYDERALFSWLDRETADQLMQRVRVRFAALPDDAFTWRTELVSALGQRP